MRTQHYLSLLSFIISTTSMLFSAYCQEDSETQILLQIKSEWGNPPALDSWNLSSGNHCSWLGLNCTGGVVTSVRLINQNLTQPIPDSMCLLKNLSYLDLANNELPGSFPKFLYNCSSLQHLNIAQNFFVGTLPTDIDKLPSSLTYFDVSGNNFTEEIPVSIGRLANLKGLHLDGNLFNGTYPVEIANLMNLEYFSLAWNPFLKPARIPDEFGNLTKLKSLWLTQTNTIGEIPFALSNLTELEHLDLGWNQINGTLPSWIWSLEKLNILYLFSNDLTGEIITGTIRCVNLFEIDVSLNKLTGSIPEGFSNLKHLSVLFLYYNLFTGEIPASLGLLPNLTDIRLFNNNLIGQLPETLGNFSKLWNLEVNDNRLAGQLPAHLCSGNNLVSIVVFNNNFAGEIPPSLANCNTLNDIQLYNNRFYGEFPSSIWSITNLNTIMIHDNEFTGMLPKRLPWNLTRLEIHNNHFTGEIPTFSERLHVFKGSNNNFHGELPENFIGFRVLQELSLGSNKIIGSISQSIQVLKSLTTLNLSSNKLTGSIPDSIGLLPVLTTLDLSNNELSGSIPQDLSKLNPTFLNLSANNLSGVIPQSFKNQAYNQSFLSNPDLCTDSNYNTILNLPVCNPTLSSSNKLSRELIAIFATLGFVILIGIGIVGFLLITARIKGKTTSYDHETAWKLTSFHKLNFTEYQVIEGLKEENVIGSGGSGKVYKISLNDDEDQIVAVKRIFVGHKMDSNLEKNFNAEVNILGQIRHANIVKLLCCISSMDSKLLVYEFMENSSLDRWLYGKERMHGSQPLDWLTRLGIAIDAARGLCYMHHSYSQPIMHRDIKSSNILLDMKFRAKIADFGLARVLEKSGEPETVSAIQGSFGYIAPECGKKRKINEKVDVYSFGVVLLELTTGKRANEGDEFEALSDWALRLFLEHGILVDMIDEEIRNDENLSDIVTVFELGLACTSKDPIGRPTMKMVLQCLSKCDPMNNIRNGFYDDQFDEAPLILSKKNSRRNMSDDFHEEDDDDSSGSFVVHVS
ncbi:Leucine-rich receptor-like protein kinase family protein [Rhynchospora pubera]|uniref:non-specific serine/threonine protein kinase n=1 Tax=Rhynchospora pubera TaxID=906938 RepID=A0AAV8ELR0_9POAL|nr:Leucine-rich receptor-like protein kinase family protein [Rhynchospora pubera]